MTRISVLAIYFLSLIIDITLMFFIRKTLILIQSKNDKKTIFWTLKSYKYLLIKSLLYTKALKTSLE